MQSILQFQKLLDFSYYYFNSWTNETFYSTNHNTFLNINENWSKSNNFKNNKCFTTFSLKHILDNLNKCVCVIIWIMEYKNN